MDLKDGNNFMASFYNIKGYDLTAFFHCVTFSEKQGLPGGNESQHCYRFDVVCMIFSQK